ncbi:DUF6484 domain-containing protein [Pseudoduganella lutea]|uniref:DUF6484 domain-containing protein n=1 Tax=Pseudoduganella lutea TaxID=321985 RepID=A0A4P6L3C3_9BURK|nr:DUF6484 domain-containing protein [Pseudoduganella lutea]QBE65904.1 hypothetical protein EWM63_25370 [Pseudoduganella lutea]
MPQPDRPSTTATTATTLTAADSPAEAPGADQLLHDVIVSTPPRARHANGIATGTLAGFDTDGTALVDIAPFDLRSVRARSVAPLDPGQVGQPVALGFEAGDPERPIVLGLMLAPAPAQAPRPAVDATIDGERVTLTAEHEIELRCGDAAIILSADGRIQIRGTYITSHADATQRIRGGSVNIN